MCVCSGGVGNLRTYRSQSCLWKRSESQHACTLAWAFLRHPAIHEQQTAAPESRGEAGTLPRACSWAGAESAWNMLIRPICGLQLLRCSSVSQQQICGSAHHPLVLAISTKAGWLRLGLETNPINKSDKLQLKTIASTPAGRHSKHNGVKNPQLKEQTWRVTQSEQTSSARTKSLLLIMSQRDVM